MQGDSWHKMKQETEEIISICHQDRNCTERIVLGLLGRMDSRGAGIYATCSPGNLTTGDRKISAARTLWNQHFDGKCRPFRLASLAHDFNRSTGDTYMPTCIVNEPIQHDTLCLERRRCCSAARVVRHVHQQHLDLASRRRYVVDNALDRSSTCTNVRLYFWLRKRGLLL